MERMAARFNGFGLRRLGVLTKTQNIGSGIGAPFPGGN
jgi:hypothetical protein